MKRCVVMRHRLRQGFGNRPPLAPCAILVLLRQEEFSFAGGACPVILGVSVCVCVFSSCKQVGFSCLTLFDSYLVQHLIEIVGISNQMKEIKME